MDYAYSANIAGWCQAIIKDPKFWHFQILWKQVYAKQVYANINANIKDHTIDVRTIDKYTGANLKYVVEPPSNIYIPIIQCSTSDCDFCKSNQCT